jgi:hypothetical protein
LPATKSIAFAVSVVARGGIIVVSADDGNFSLPMVQWV